MRVVLADPPAYTPPYDHELAAALARASAEVDLVTSRFRFGAVPEPVGYRRREIFYPFSARLFRRSRLRLPVKALEHPVGMARLALSQADVVHLQWLSLPQADRLLLRTRAPLVFTAHDLLPRRTASRVALWRNLYRRFDRVVVHTDRGAEALRRLGLPDERIRVIPHPVFARDVSRRDDGRTLLFFGVIRAYRGLPDALEVARRAGARLIVAGDPVERVDGIGRVGVDWRLGYLSEAEVDGAHAESTVAVFPYRPEIDQSGSLLRALGSGVPAVVYDVGGLAEPVQRFGAGRVVAAGDVEAMAAAVSELLGNPEALDAARAGAERARDELSWDRAAQAHLELYRELV